MRNRITNLSRSIIKKKDDCILYGGLAHPDGTYDAKEVPGIVSYLDEIKDFDEMVKKWEAGQCPFEDDNCLALDNQDGANTTDSSTVTGAEGSRVWTSVYGIAFGTNGVFTTYPSNLPLLGGYGLNYRMDIPAKYEDKYDGLTKHESYDLVTGEATFGVGVANRFSLVGLRNIYLLVHQVAEYLNNRIVRVDLGNNSNGGQANTQNVTSIEVVPGIMLYSDFAITRTEAFVS